MSWYRKIWEKVSSIGMERGSGDITSRTNIINNQLNATLFLIMVGLSIILKILRVIDDRTINIGGYRFLWMMAFCVIHYVLAKNRFFNLSKLLLVVMPPVLFLIIPSFLGFVEDQSFFYYPYIVITFSLFPQLIINPKRQSLMYLFSMLYYLGLIIGIDYLLLMLAPDNLRVVPMVKEFWVNHKMANVSIYLFINFSVYYLKLVNLRYEKQLKDSKLRLEYNNKQLDVSIEELRATNDHLKNTQQQLVQSEKMASLGTLTAGVAHEINTPLNFISTGALLVKNAIEDIDEGVTIDRVKKDLEQSQDIIDRGVEQASFVVSSLMTFSYSGKSKKQLHDVTSIVESTLLFLKGKMPPDIIIEKRLELDQMVFIYADKIHQVIINILDNAISAISEVDKKQIKIHTYGIQKGGNDYACLSIFNSGSPIKKQIESKIFDPFFTTKSINQGTGLGLSLAYNMIQEHGGEITFSNHSDGVEFLIEVPLVQK